MKKILIIFFAFVTYITYAQVTPPNFPGGDKGFYKFCSQNFEFSDDILKNHVTSNVPISIFISKTGEVDSVVFQEQGHPLIMAQLNTMFTNIPSFEPAERNKKPISSQLNLTINVSLPTVNTEKISKYKFEKAEGIATMVFFGQLEFFTYKGIEIAEELHEMAKKAQKEGDLFAAHDHLQLALTYAPDNMEVLHDLGIVAFNIGLNLQACDCWKKGYEMGDSDSESFFQKNNCK